MKIDIFGVIKFEVGDEVLEVLGIVAGIAITLIMLISLAVSCSTNPVYINSLQK